MTNLIVVLFMCALTALVHLAVLRPTLLGPPARRTLEDIADARKKFPRIYSGDAGTEVFKGQSPPLKKAQRGH